MCDGVWFASLRCRKQELIADIFTELERTDGERGRDPEYSE
jgi:hypothetical protein